MQIAATSRRSEREKNIITSVIAAVTISANCVRAPALTLTAVCVVPPPPGIAPKSAPPILASPVANNGAFAVSAAFAKKIHLLWLGVGTAEPERMRAGLQRLHNSLIEANFQHVFYESPDTDHEWQTWRRDLKDFAPRLF